jgi:flavin reductase (DIM6/NTAB) family NADH-FMN oxidoreductase RutF
MVSVALQRTGRGLAELLRTSSFVVNGLAAGQEALARHFARKDRGASGEELWAACTTEGVPLLDGAVGWLECRIERTVPAGDHELVLAEVVNAVCGTGIPLLNYGGHLHTPPIDVRS